MSTKKTILTILSTIAVLSLVIAGMVALLVYTPPLSGSAREARLENCPEEQVNYLCVLRSYLVPSPDRL